MSSSLTTGTSLRPQQSKDEGRRVVALWREEGLTLHELLWVASNSIIPALPEELSQLDLNKLRKAGAANVQIIAVMPSFQFDNIYWDAVGDLPAVLDVLLRCFDLSHKAAIRGCALSLAEWQQTKNSGI